MDISWLMRYLQDNVSSTLETGAEDEPPEKFCILMSLVLFNLKPVRKHGNQNKVK